MTKVKVWKKKKMRKLRREGHSIREIAKFLNVSDHTVRYHIDPIFRKRFKERERAPLTLEQKKTSNERRRERYREDPEYRKSIHEKNKRAGRKKQGYIVRPPKCNRCGLKIERYDNLEQFTAQSKAAAELLGVKYSKKLNMHKACWALVPRKEKRILLGDDFTSLCLNIKHEIWLRLSEEGDFLYDTMFSDIPEVDRRLQEMKLKDRLSPEDLETLRNLLNDMGGENA